VCWPDIKGAVSGSGVGVSSLSIVGLLGSTKQENKLLLIFVHFK